MMESRGGEIDENRHGPLQPAQLAGGPVPVS